MFQLVRGDSSTLILSSNVSLLHPQNDNVEYVILRASNAVAIPKVLQAAQRTKRRRLDAGDRNELLQYIQYGATISQTGTVTERRTRGDTVDKEPTQSSGSFIVRLCKIKPAPSSQLRVDRRTVLSPQVVRDVVIERKNNTRSKGKNIDRGGLKEEVGSVLTSDKKGKGKADKRAEEKERRKKEREEGLARKMKEEYEAEERRRREASEECRQEKEKPLNETRAEIHERRQRTKEAEEERRKELMKEAEEKKEREGRAKKEKTRGKAAQKPYPGPPVTDTQLEAGRLVKGTVSTARSTIRPLAKTSASRASGRFAASS